MLILAIETSCDETAAAVVRDGRQVLSSVVASQVKVHAEYGGVVPEIASRQHLEAIVPVIEEALSGASVTFADLDGIGVTQGPGLVGALLVGLGTAKGIAQAISLPIVGVNHIEGHLLAAFLEGEVEFPYLALVVSGGHTHLYEVQAVGRYRTLGQTLDDAAGEAFDKVGKLLGLPYPGGPLIDRLAAAGNPAAIKFPRPLLRDGSFNFSFSGLKTAVYTHLQRHPEARSDQALHDLCASFQEAACEVLTAKTAAAVASTGIRRVVVAGGVACNRGLRRSMASMAEQQGISVVFPSPALCADNAAMLAVAADHYLRTGWISPLQALDALPTWPLEQVMNHLQQRHE
jgi:N6-L-threonylcarbamoyladenine synthase